MKIGGYETHPAADLFPLIEGQALDSLAEDIREHGQQVPAVLHEGKILDGRNRVLACKRAGVEPRTVDWKPHGSPTAWVLSVNLHRRHLNESQRSMVSARAKPLFEGEAKARQKAHGGTAPGKKSLSANVREVKPAKASAQAAALTNVSTRSTEHATRVLRDGARETIAAVDSGRLAVSAAADLVKLPAAKQREIIERIERRDGTEARPGLVRALVKQEAKREVAAQINAEPAPMPAGPFRVMVSDPPWAYEKRAGDATHRGDLPYPPMTTAEICALPVGQLAHPDACILWLWTTNAFMRDAYRVLDAWGFQEKTILTWVKDRMGLGDWLRGQTEHCILAVRGKPTVTLTNETTVLHGPMREHSRKPDEFYALVERLCPGSKLEMFARAPRQGWVAWGAESEKFDAA